MKQNVFNNENGDAEKEEMMSETYYDLSLRRGEIRKYARHMNVFGDYNIGYCLIMSDSGKLNNRVLICPLYTLEQVNKRKNLQLVRFAITIHGEEVIVYGSLLEIRFVSKRKFVEFGDEDNKVVDEVDLFIVHKTLEIYAAMIAKIMTQYKKEWPAAC